MAILLKTNHRIRTNEKYCNGNATLDESKIVLKTTSCYIRHLTVGFLRFLQSKFFFLTVIEISKQGRVVHSKTNI